MAVLTSDVLFGPRMITHHHPGGLLPTLRKFQPTGFVTVNRKIPGRKSVVPTKTQEQSEDRKV